MKRNSLRLLTILMALVMLMATRITAMAISGSAVNQDGVTAQLFADKNAYKTGELVNAYVQVDNNTDKQVTVSVQINVPEGLELVGDDVFEDILEAGESWKTAEGVIIESEDESPSTSEDESLSASAGETSTIIYIILAVLAVCSVIAVFLLSKKRKETISVLLCLAMISGMVVTAAPVKAEDIKSDIPLSCAITVDGKEVELTASVSYVIHDNENKLSGEYIFNGDFEKAVWFNGFESWTAVNTELPHVSTIAHDGQYALQVSNKNDRVYQLVEVQPGITYELTGYVKLVESTGDARFGVIGYSQDLLEEEYQTFSSGTMRFSKYINTKDLKLENDTLVRGDWMKFTYPLEVAQNTNYLYIYLEGQSGAVYYDDISLHVKLSENLFSGYGQLFAVTPLSQYEISGNLQTNGTDTRVKWQGYSKNAKSPEYATTFSGEIKIEDTGHFSRTIEIDKETEYLAVYLQGNSGMFDDVAVRKIQEPDKLSMLLSSNSYYAEETGIAIVKPNTAAFANTDNWTGCCQVLQGEKVIWSRENIDFSKGELEIPFPLTACNGKDYIFKATLYIDGVEMESVQWTFDRCYERPAVLNDEGIFVEKDGDVFHPVMAYHMMSPDISLDIIDDCIDRLGVNLFQFNKGYSNEDYWDEARKHLDYLASKGAKAIICLYRRAGNDKNAICSVPENKEAVIKYIQAICDHEAIFAWAVQDEPVGHGTSEELMREAYDMVRTYDTKHRPVYVIDQREHGYPKLIRNADVIAIDNYPYGKFDAMTYIYNSAKYAVETAEASNKPIYTLLQCFENRTGEYINPNLPEGTPYMPTANAIRNMIYQSLMAGTKGFGYYGFDYGPGEDGDAYNFDTSGYVQKEINVRTSSDLVKGIEEYVAKEQDLMFEYFVEKKYSTFNANIDGSKDMRYVSFVKNGKVYMVILNKHEFTEQTVSVPLTSDNGAVTITGFTAKAYAGILDEKGEVIATKTISDTDSTFDVTLAPGAAAVYIITPNKTIDWSTIQ